VDGAGSGLDVCVWMVGHRCRWVPLGGCVLVRAGVRVALLPVRSWRAPTLLCPPGGLGTACERDEGERGGDSMR